MSLVPNLDNPEAMPFGEQLQGNWQLVVLEKGTCTYRAGERFAGAAFEEPPELLEVSSFPEAIEVSKAAGRILLLPNLATPHVAYMETSPDRTTLNQYVFTYSNPPLYLARAGELAAASCAAITHLKSLVFPEDGVTKWLEVDNTQKAAEACADGRASLCITNQEGLDRYELEVVRELKRMQPSWHSYTWEPHQVA